MVSLSIKQTREKERKKKGKGKKSSSYRIVLARPAGLNTFPFGTNVCHPPPPNIHNLCSIGGKQSPLRWTPMSFPTREIGENERNGRSLTQRITSQIKQYTLTLRETGVVTVCVRLMRMKKKGKASRHKGKKGNLFHLSSSISNSPSSLGITADVSGLFIDKEGHCLRFGILILLERESKEPNTGFADVV